jgi:hypothetical protein
MITTTTIIETTRGRNLPELIMKKINSPNKFFKINLIIEPVEENKNKWAQVAKKISEQSPLSNLSEDLIKSSQEFRNNFNLKNAIHS